MKRFNILRTLTFLILAYGIFSGASCLKGNGTEPDSLCGVEKKLERTFRTLDYTTTRVENGMREFIYSDTSVDNICTEEHIKAEFYVFNRGVPPPPTDLKLYGEAYWSLFGRNVALEYDAPSDLYSNHLEIGLKQAFQGKPGSLGLQVVITFPTRGDIDADKKYLETYIDDVDIVLAYREYI